MKATLTVNGVEIECSYKLDQRGKNLVAKVYAELTDDQYAALTGIHEFVFESDLGTLRMKGMIAEGYIVDQATNKYRLIIRKVRLKSGKPTTSFVYNDVSDQQRVQV